MTLYTKSKFDNVRASKKDREDSIRQASYFHIYLSRLIEMIKNYEQAIEYSQELKKEYRELKNRDTDFDRNDYNGLDRLSYLAGLSDMYIETLEITLPEHRSKVISAFDKLRSADINNLDIAIYNDCLKIKEMYNNANLLLSEIDKLIICEDNLFKYLKKSIKSF